MSAAKWVPDEWVRPAADGIEPRILNWNARETGCAPGYQFYLHDHANGAKGTILATDTLPTLEEAQAASDAALATVLAERAQHAAMVAEGAPEVAGQAVACG